MNINCAMSLVQKRCPRHQFECHRCAAKLQNSETVWELSVPTYISWRYNSYDFNGTSIGGTPFSVNSPGIEPIVIQSTYQKIPKNSDGSLQNCNFNAVSALEYQVPQSGGVSPSTASSWPSWVRDYDISRITDMSPTEPYYIIDPDLIPFYVPGKFSPPIATWQSFSRDHSALIHFLEPVIENGNVTTPGAWRITLGVDQEAAYRRAIMADTYNFGTLAEMNAFIDGLSPLDVFTANETTLIVEVGYAESTAADGSVSFSGVYEPPDDFTCPIKSGETYRFMNIIPYDLPPLRVSFTDPVIPEGYGTPKSGIVYPLKPDRDATSEGESFSFYDYYAPPYIDVRHVKRSDQDVE